MAESEDPEEGLRDALMLRDEDVMTINSCLFRMLRGCLQTDLGMHHEAIETFESVKQDPEGGLSNAARIHIDRVREWIAHAEMSQRVGKSRHRKGKR